MFHRPSKHLEFRQKYSAARRNNLTLFSVFGYPDETLSLVFDILLHTQVMFFYFKDILTLFSNTVN